MLRTLFTNQNGKSPQTSSQGNKYQMIFHIIYSNSTWVKPIKNRTEGGIIDGLK